MWNGMVVEDLAPTSGCSWPVVATCPPTDPPLDEAIREWTEAMAIEILWSASGRRFGICASTYRPCARSGCEPGFPMVNAWELVGNGGSLAWDPWGGSVFAAIDCGCTSGCQCTTVEALRLWHAKVRTVTEVMIDGVVLAPDFYRLSGNTLYRTDGDLWPTCQDFTVDADQVGAWSVSYTHGRSVPIGGRVSAGILQCELAKAVAGDEDCALPQRVQSVTRQGVSIAFLDPMTFLDQGRTGLYEVDLWLQSVNPNRLQRGARVYRHDAPSRRR